MTKFTRRISHKRSTRDSTAEYVEDTIGLISFKKDQLEGLSEEDAGGELARSWNILRRDLKDLGRRKKRMLTGYD